MNPLTEIRCVALGLPQPQGSKRHVGNGIMIDDNKHLRAWRDSVAIEIARATPEGWSLTTAYQVRVELLFPRPANHYGKKGLRPSAPVFKITRPDVDKLLRAVLDAGTQAGAWRDDSQVWAVEAVKGFTQFHPRTEITITAERET